MSCLPSPSHHFYRLLSPFPVMGGASSGENHCMMLRKGWDTNAPRWRQPTDVQRMFFNKKAQSRDFRVFAIFMGDLCGYTLCLLLCFLLVLIWFDLVLLLSFLPFFVGIIMRFLTSNMIWMGLSEWNTRELLQYGSSSQISQIVVDFACMFMYIDPSPWQSQGYALVLGSCVGVYDSGITQIRSFASVRRAGSTKNNPKSIRCFWWGWSMIHVVSSNKHGW